MLNIRTATIADAALLRQLIWELADYERAPDEVHTTAADLARDGFGEIQHFRALIAEWEGQPAGYAVFFDYYSTWRGLGIYLEDVFVRPNLRGRGIGGALMSRVARIALREGRGFMKWEVLNWNKPALDVYKSMGAEFLEEWRSAFLVGDSLTRLAEKDS